mmetsp:Transcript_19346/g.17155  ORF Transcript_19346/g.17155 Transcript_19346/m.17155 type:complete len:224 (+) Transcript_19346:243-914(+)
MQIYFSAIYFASVTITTIGYGDFSGSIHQEVFFTVICIIIGSIYYSFFISIVGGIFSNRSLRANMLSKYIGYIEILKRNYDVPDELALHLRAHFDQISKNLTFSDRDKKYDIYQILESFPKTLQHEIRMQIYSKAINTVEFLQDRSYEFYFQLLPLFIPHKFLKQSFIFKENQIATNIYIFVKGMALNMTTKTLIHEPCLIGEGDVVHIRKRQENIIAVEECD